MSCSVAWRGSAKNGDLTHRRRRHLQQCVALLAERYQCVACSGLDHTQIVAAENEVPLKQLDKVALSGLNGGTVDSDSDEAS